MNTAPCLAILIAVLAAPAQADQGAPLAPGDRVRLHTSSGKVLGTVQTLAPDELVIETAGAGSRAFARADLRRLEISNGRSSKKGATTGFVVGSVIGAGLGLWYKAALEETESSSMFALLPIIGAGICGAAGAGVGALAKQEQWREAPPTPLSIYLSASGTGVRVSLSVRF